MEDFFFLLIPGLIYLNLLLSHLEDPLVFLLSSDLFLIAFIATLDNGAVTASTFNSNHSSSVLNKTSPLLSTPS